MTPETPFKPFAFDVASSDASLVELGRAIAPDMLGDDAGYVAQARRFIQEHQICRYACEVLADRKVMEPLDLAVILAGKLLASRLPTGSALDLPLAWKVGVYLARSGIPAVVGCKDCPVRMART